ncbi:MAG: SpoIID/LytB domain-containing protein [Flavobacteriales bacterium]|nr:SpoIID/LytB domain-containing protein [Flavobacteriales bacterium]
MKKLTLLLLLLFLFFKSTFAEMLNVGILDKQAITSFIFYPQEGKYIIYTESGKIEEIDNTEIIELSFWNNKITVKSLEKDYGSFLKIRIIGVATKNAFKLKTNKPLGKIIQYEDNLFIRVHPYNNYLQLINNIDIDNYVAGVVEAEVGKSHPEEYFKLQAIICRTYALKNIKKHENEGFSMCDKVHCQAYHGKPKSEIIHQAAELTSNIVIVDSEINLITATFFSNCGGQTANSQDVWHSNLYYLKSVKDTFCLHENNSIWSKRIPKGDWIQYLITQHNYPKENLNDICDIEYFQLNREQYFEKNNVQIPFVKIRSDWNLKSAQFDVSLDNNFVILSGKGFGHGVGLCQEGAMRMAKMGYSYADILHFYYEGVHMINLKSLNFFKTDF